MSQYKKSAIEKQILKSAKAIFLKRGFLNATLRDITSDANITLGNIYNYYADKDALFVAVLQPILDDFERLCEYGRHNQAKDGPFESLEEKKQIFRFALEYINKHRKDLNLLFNHSAGSSLENYSDYLAREYEKNWDLYFVFLKEKFPNNQFRKPSSFFLRNMAHFHLMTIGKFLNNNLSYQEMIAMTDEIAMFLWYGGMGLLNAYSTQNFK